MIKQFQPLVSLLMAAYNNVAYIKWAIESVQAQTYKNWELIIVDDYSTDGTFELATALAKKDKRIKLFRNPKNIGYNLTMCETSSKASGDFQAHFDSDDMLERWAIQVMVEEFEKQPDVMIMYSDMAQIGKKNEVEAYSMSKPFNKDKLWEHGWRHFGMYRTSVFDHIYGYNDKLNPINNGCGDGDLFMQIVEKFPAYHVPKVLYFYRNHGNNMSPHNGKCQECRANPNCNYIRVWANSLNYDQRTLTKKV